jgi:hypothetical protein
MEKTLIEIREERIQALFADCQQQVISQIIGPFGLSTAMFKDIDSNGGSVTTVHNFENEDSTYIAPKDQLTYGKSREDYKENKKILGGVPKDIALKVEANGVDGYTGKNLEINPTQSDRKFVSDIDHVNSKKEIWSNKKSHLAFETGKDLEQMKKVIHSEENFVATDPSLNRSKGDRSLKDFTQASDNGTTNAERFEIDSEKCAAAQQRADDHLNSNINKALFQKQGMEILQTGSKQAVMMGIRQSLGLLLTELVNGLFNEFKVLIKQGVEAGKTLFEEIRQRLARVIESVAKKIPEAVGQMVQGGISGFMSNLLTFLINNFLSTAKRFVTVIREGLISLFRAFKIILFPPKHMTGDQAMQEGLKILTGVVITSVGVILTETVATFMATMPFLKPFADLITPVLIGILTGLLSAFLAYQIDCLFDRYRHSLSEKFMDELQSDAKRRDEFANELITLSETSLGNIENYSKSINLYQNIGATLGKAGLAANATLASLEQTVAETGEQVTKSLAMIDFINTSQSEIEDFLKTI